MKSLLAATAALALLTQSCPQPWKDKDPALWTAEECDRFFRFSPWVHRRFYGSTIDVYRQYRPEGTEDTSHWSESVLLASALPVKLATLREIQLHSPHLVNVTVSGPKLADYSNTVVVTYGSSSYRSGSSFPVQQPTPPGTPSRQPVYRSALILADGRAILPQSETPAAPKNESFRATFPRYVDGKPIHELSGSHIVFARGEFSATETKIQRRYKFKISDLVYRGKIEY